MLNRKQFTYALRLIGALASDIHEMRTVREHIAALPVSVRGPITTEVLVVWGYEGSGYDDPDAYLDHLHTVIGAPHLDLVRDLKRWFVIKDPRLSDEDFEVNVHGYGYARDRKDEVMA